MSATFDAQATAKIELLRRQFAQRMNNDANFIRSAFDRIGPQAAPDAEVTPLRKICHSLCGAAGVFGYPVVAEAASRMSAAFASGERDGVRLASLARALIGEIQSAVTDP